MYCHITRQILLNWHQDKSMFYCIEIYQDKKSEEIYNRQAAVIFNV